MNDNNGEVRDQNVFSWTSISARGLPRAKSRVPTYFMGGTKSTGVILVVNKNLFALKNVTKNIKTSSSKTPILLKQVCSRRNFVYHKKIRVHLKWDTLYRLKRFSKYCFSSSNIKV